MNRALVEYGLLCFTTLFTMMNPVGIIPHYIAMTEKLDPQQSRRIAIRAILVATIIMFLFALTGNFLFNFFSISIHSMRIVGGVIFFILGYEMLHARLSRIQHDHGDRFTHAQDLAITPLAIPIICGPGAITTVIIFMNTADTFAKKGILCSCIIAVILLTFLMLISGKKIMSFLGESGNKVLMRIMGLIVMVIAVEFFFSGLKPILQEIFKITGT
jgi:multiple antibiotic resistance protein